MIDFGFGIVLTTLDDIDSETIREWRNDYRIYRYCRQFDLISKNAHDDWQLNNKEKMYSIVGDYAPVGVCGLTNIDMVNRRAEFSLYIHPDNQRKGYGSAALKTLVSHGFSNFGLNSIWGESYDFNPARKMFEEVGLSIEGSRREFYYREGEFCDAVLYGILKSEWEKSEIYEGGRIQKCST